VIAIFRSDAPASLRRIDSALRRHDSEALRMAAHAVKGAIATVGSPAGREAASELESMARSSSWVEAHRAVDELRRVMRQLDDAFQAAGLLPRASTRKRVRRATPRKRSKR